MNWFDFVVACFGLFILGFIFTRGVNDHVIEYVLNRSTKKKRKKGQNFFDWLFYRRFRDVLPKSYRVCYYMVLISFPIMVAAILILSQFVDYDIVRPVCMLIYALLAIGRPFWINVSWGLFRVKRLDPGRTIERKKRNKK